MLTRENLSSFAVNRHGDLDHDIGVQSHADRAVTHHLDRSCGHADLRFGHGIAVLGEFFSDVEVGDRTEQASVHTGFLAQLDGSTGQFFTLGLSRCQLMGVSSMAAANYQVARPGEVGKSRQLPGGKPS